MTNEQVNLPIAEDVDINLLLVDEKNPNRMSKQQKEALKINLLRFGFIVPIITNKDYLVADGQHRLEAANEEVCFL
jgi:ParB-like chromosome segregation protein Spo0J